MKRLKTIKIKEAFDWMESLDNPRNTDFMMKKLNEENVHSSLLNYKVFKHKGIACVSCNIKGEFFAIEKTPGPGSSIYNDWHLNLYAVDAIGREILMTKDHIHPKSEGGKDELENFQTMCSKCNRKKASHPMEVFNTFEKIDHSRDLPYAKKFIENIKTYYGIEASLLDYNFILKQLKNHSKILNQLSESKTYKEIKFKEKQIIVLQEFGSITDIIPYSRKKEILKKLPFGCSPEYQKYFDDTIKLIKEEYNRFDYNNKTKEEIHSYFQTCSYPSLMIRYHKKDDVLMINTWKMVSRKSNK